MEYIPFPDAVGVESSAPQAELKLYSGVPWDYNYTHVRKYSNRTQLDTFLETLVKFTTTEVSFISMGEIDIAIDYNQALAYKCNYMRFVNTPWDNTPHYAFIRSVTPVSATVTHVKFELDVWNECQFDIELKECFVEREIVKKSSDIRGRYTYPEGLQLGDYVVNGNNSLSTIPAEGDERREVVYCVASAVDNNAETAEMSLYQNVPCGLYIGVYTSLADLQTYIENVITAKGSADDIVDAWEMPAAFADVNNIVKKTFSFSKKSIKDINGYTPKNNKLFAYPYSFLQMTNNSGQIKQFEFERFHTPGADDLCNFYYTVNVSPNPTLYCYPQYYKGVQENFGDSITFNGYPKIAFPVDAYKAWLAQNSNNLIMSLATGDNVPTNTGDWIGRSIMTVGQSIAGIGDIIGAIGGEQKVTGNQVASNFGNSVYSLLSGNYQAQLQADGIKGSISNTLPKAANFDCISVYPVSITAEFAKVIDDYFSMFGYKICRVKKPDITGRPSWNYVKTQNCSIDGKFPIDMLEKMRKIFDNGVTVWHTNDIGNYALNNE